MAVMTFWKPHALAKPHADQLDLRIGDRVHYPDDPDDRGTVVARERTAMRHVVLIILWDVGQCSVEQWGTFAEAGEAPALPAGCGEQTNAGTYAATISPGYDRGHLVPANHMDQDDATIALTIINLARSLQLKVVAEGVEDQAQLESLMHHGCDQVQGFLLARPMDFEAFLAWQAARLTAPVQ